MDGDIVSPAAECAPVALNRDAFAIPDGVTYLNCAYMAPQLRRVSEAGIAGLRRKEQPWTITPPDFFDDLERLRTLFAHLVGGDVDGVAVVPAASHALSAAAANVAASQGDRIVVLDEQYPSNVYPWRELAARTDATVIAVPRPSDAAWSDAVVAEIDERTVAVAVPNCHFRTGALLDLRAIGAAARSVDAVFVIDATQSVGVVPLDVGVVDADVVVAAGYKWLLGPYSVGYSWTAARRRHWRPLELHWAGRERSHDFANLTQYTDAFLPGARRFDGGEASNFALLPMAVAALETLTGWTVDRVAATIEPLTRAAVEGAASLGLSVHDERHAPHIAGLRMPVEAAERVAGALADAQVHVSVRGDSLRVSPHVYNTADDVGRLLEALRAAL